MSISPAPELEPDLKKINKSTMPGTLDDIPPLIPVPIQASVPVNVHTVLEDTADNDQFASLFSPPTPPASPAPTPIFSDSPFAVDARRTLGHSRAPKSADSDFGNFVYVPAPDDPLHASMQDTSDPFSPIPNVEFFDKFTEEARAATEENKRELIDELLIHEDNPLYRSNSAGDGTTSHAQEPSPLSPHEENLVHATSTDMDHPNGRISRHPHRDANRTESGAMVTSDDEHSPVRHSPVLRRSRSSTFSSLSSRWISSLLSAPRTPSAITTSFEQAPMATVNTRPSPIHPEFVNRKEHQEHHQVTLPASLPSHILSSSETFNSLPSSLSAAKTITHGSPFAAQTYVPPSGAPGFAGDRKWNKGFEFNKDQVEKKSIKLLGRKEMTSPVLTVEIADMIRSHLPALARLPRSWSLLYSLDQHGISLATLYTRCQSHPGGALLVIRDAGDALFGAWIGEGVHPSKGSYYGGGESFLWRMQGHDIQVYRWAGRNDYVALCEADYLSLGGGDGHYGLYVNDTLLDGSSAPCPTFCNEPLCSSAPRKGETVSFECVGLEIWGMGP